MYSNSSHMMKNEALQKVYQKFLGNYPKVSKSIPNISVGQHFLLNYVKRIGGYSLDTYLGVLYVYQIRYFNSLGGSRLQGNRTINHMRKTNK